MKKFLCLGIESTAHTFGIGIVAGHGKVLANVKDAFTTEHGGLIPAQVADHHYGCAPEILKKALETAKVKLEDINLIAFSQGPGIGTALNVGAITARSLSQKLKVPLVGVNHCIAHLEIGKLRTKATDPVLLYASGANTQVIARQEGKYRILGESLDIGVGNFLDVFARDIDLGFPGGPKVERLALKGKKYIELPYVVKGMDVSFGGILTNIRQKAHSKKFSKEDLCYSAQETVFAMLIEISERAMAHAGKKELLLGGGVACNKRLQEMARIMCKERGAKSFCPENEFLVDNGAMIAWNGIVSYRKKLSTPLKKSEIRPYLRLEDNLFG
ncbi:MAG: bifunctional N(6)-L-threonylcarbamoyladenine synthase/serine/threonine protein kinase [Nanoarchaeota archaeon]|nr:MAG: bifunctional N(6)-L-threonylcarbamoyladenine synthase/serine/threonine protein kinase [Nanoarchaeota archaeon]